MISERTIKKQITDWLTDKELFWWRQQSGMMIGRRGLSRYAMNIGRKGMPDLFVLHPDKSGRAIGIEVKKPGEKLRYEQVNCHYELKKWGVVVLVAHSLEDITFIEKYITP